jgi:hypothetical protein
VDNLAGGKGGHLEAVGSAEGARSHVARVLSRPSQIEEVSKPPTVARIDALRRAPLRKVMSVLRWISSPVLDNARNLGDRSQIYES